MSKVKWGVIGPGNIASNFVSDFQYITNGEVVAVGSRSKSRASEFADRHAIAVSYGSYDELCQSDEVDAIYVATPHNFHFEQASLAIKYGKAVLCEKPITTSLKDFHVLRRQATENKTLLMEGMWTYFLPAIKKAKQWINEGRIGVIKHIKSDFGFYADFDPQSRLFNPELAGGALLDIGIYPIALANYFLEGLPTDIKVHSRKASTGVDSDVMMSFKYPEVMATLHASLECRLPNYTYVIGDEGYIEIPNAWQAKNCSLYKESECVDHFNDGRTNFGFNYEIEAFNADFIEGRRESRIMPHATSEQLQSLMEKVAALF